MIWFLKLWVVRYGFNGFDYWMHEWMKAQNTFPYNWWHPHTWGSSSHWLWPSPTNPWHLSPSIVVTCMYSAAAACVFVSILYIRIMSSKVLNYDLLSQLQLLYQSFWVSIIVTQTAIAVAAATACDCIHSLDNWFYVDW